MIHLLAQVRTQARQAGATVMEERNTNRVASMGRLRDSWIWRCNNSNAYHDAISV
jgi:hypothetical protein